MSPALALVLILLVIVMQGIVLLLGCFIDTISIMLISIPVFMPIILELGIDPIWFCILILVQLELAGITPPFGVLLFVMKGVSAPGTRMRDIYISALPFIGCSMLLVALLIVFPGIATWLPSLGK